MEKTISKENEKINSQKKREALIILGSLVVFFLLVGVSVVAILSAGNFSSNNTFSLGLFNGGKYNKAITHLNNAEYSEALILFEELANKDYQNSAEMIYETKYRYVSDNFDNNNETTYMYLQELVNNNYKDSAILYTDLYSWKARVFFNTSQNSRSEAKVIYATKRVFPIYFAHYELSGGTPGAEFRGEYVITYSDGSTYRANYVGRDSDITYSIACSATQSPIGVTRLDLYDDKGNLINSGTVEIK